MPRSSPPSEPLPNEAVPGGAGIWSLDGDRLTCLERFDIGPATVLVPTEQVLLLTAELPLAGLRRRAEALPFAIEDAIATPLAEAHVSLGAELSPRRHLAGVVAHAVMAGWVARLAEAGLGHARIVPDALALPMPPLGGWSVDLAEARAMVRTDDGAGFALPASHLDAAWRAAGQPRCIAYGAPLAFADEAPLEPDALAARLAAPALDLRQGRYARPRRALPPLARRIATVAALGLAAHGAIAAVDTLALDRIAAKHVARARALIVQVAPDAPAGDDLASSAADVLPANGSGSSSFLPLLARVGGALRRLGSAATLRGIAYDGAADTLSLQVETNDIAGLQRVSAALAAQGLNPESGAASADQGKAVGAFLVRGAS